MAYKEITTRLTIGALALIALFSLIPKRAEILGNGDSDLLLHFCGYAVLAILLSLWLLSKQKSLWVACFFAFSLAALLGFGIELAQIPAPERAAEISDFWADFGGAFFGAAAVFVFKVRY